MTSQTHPLVTYLERLAAPPMNRGALAALRTAWQPGREYAALALILPWLGSGPTTAGSERERRRREDDALLLAGLFALHPVKGSRSVPQALALVAAKAESGSIEGRFTAILASEREDLPTHLRHAVSLIASRDIGLDWGRLHDDLHWWGAPGDRVRRRWARQYWTPGAEAPDEEETTNKARSDEGIAP